MREDFKWISSYFRLFCVMNLLSSLTCQEGGIWAPNPNAGNILSLQGGTTTLLLRFFAQLLSSVHALPFSYTPVVVLDDIANRPDSGQVLIDALRTDVVQRLRRSGIPVGACEVDGHLVKRQQMSDAVEER